MFGDDCRLRLLREVRLLPALIDRILRVELARGITGDGILVDDQEALEDEPSATVGGLHLFHCLQGQLGQVRCLVRNRVSAVVAVKVKSVMPLLAMALASWCAATLAKARVPWRASAASQKARQKSALRLPMLQALPLACPLMT